MDKVERDKIRNVGLLILFLAAIGALIDSCNKLKIVTQNRDAIEESFKSERNAANEEITSMKTLLIEKNTEISIKDKNIQKLLTTIKEQSKKGFKTEVGVIQTTNTILNGKDHIDTIWVDTLSHEIVKVDTITAFGKWVSGVVMVTNDSIEYRNFTVIDSTIVLFGKRKKGLFKVEPTVTIVHANPYVSTKSMSSIQYTNKPFIRPLTVFGIGLSLGFITTVLILK